MSYPGSKAQDGTFQLIIGQMPPHSVYVEPFFGSGQIFWRKRRAASSIVMDRKADHTLLATNSASADVRGTARPEPARSDNDSAPVFLPPHFLHAIE